MITNRVKNYLILGLLALLLISGGLNLYQSSLRKNDRINAELSEARNQTEIAGHKALAKSYADRAREVDSVRTRDRDSVKVAVSALKIENQGYKKTIARLRPLVADKIAADPNLTEFSGAQDSTILKQDSIINRLEVANANEIGKAAEIDQLKRKEIGELVLMINGLQDNLVSEQDKARKAERKAKKRFGLGVNAGYGVMVTGGEVRVGPTVNAGLSFRLLRF